VLLVVAGLVLRTLASTQAIDPGFAYERLLASHISTSSTNVTVEGRDRFFRDVAARIAEEPWVASATVAVNAVLSPQASRELIMEGHGEPATTLYSLVLPNFFETLRMPLVEGRSFSPGDTAGASPVVIVNERLADAYFGGGSSLGRRIWWGGTGEDKDRMFEVVGVVQDSRMLDFLAEPEPMAYFAYPQHSYPSGSALIIETQGDPSTFVPELQQWLRAYEPHLAIVNVLPYSEVVRGFLYTQRMNAELFSALATLGLTLAAVGLFSVMSLAVARRTQEIGIRMAIGARRGRIGRLMVRRALTPVAVGAAVGLGAAMLLTSLAESLLFGVERTDPLTIAVSIGVLVVAALLAAYLPARRAAAVDPVVALKTN
jgi:predicted permease